LGVLGPTAGASRVNYHRLITHKSGAEDNAMADFDKELDASGLNCPLPVLRTKKALGDMQSGQVLHVIATDPGSVKDFEAFAKQTGNELLESREEGGKFHFRLKKK
jgi:tRNA 2-thiouridine synthesizing protein A